MIITGQMETTDYGCVAETANALLLITGHNGNHQLMNTNELLKP